jgi:cytochrome c-type biogenesis protein CcsB
VNLETVLFRASEYSLFASFFASTAAAVIQKVRHGKQTEQSMLFIRRAVRMLALLPLALLSAWLVVRTVQTGHSPFSNMYEFSVVFVWGVVLMAMIFLWKYGSYIIHLLCLLAASALILYAGTLSAQAKPLVPALQNNLLLTVHVFTAVIAYGAFTLGFIASVLLLIQKGDRFASLPPQDKLERIGYQSVLIGFPMMTLVIVLGAIWADIAWGVFWSWDPKETASLVTWLIYAGYLHTRVLKKWRGRKSALLLIVGFAAVVFTFFGNYLFGGLHAYA